MISPTLDSEDPGPGNSQDSSAEDQMSPTDGYFNTRSHPQNMHLATRPAPSASKNSEATVESLLQSNLSSSAFSDGPPTPSSSSIWSNEETPLIRRVTPPPAYSTASYTPSQPAYSGSSQERRDHSTTWPSPAANTDPPQLPGHDIEARLDSSPPAGRDPWRKRKKRSPRFRKMLAKMVMLLLSITGLIWIAMMVQQYWRPEASFLVHTCPRDRMPTSATKSDHHAINRTLLMNHQTTWSRNGHHGPPSPTCQNSQTGQTGTRSAPSAPQTARHGNSHICPTSSSAIPSGKENKARFGVPSDLYTSLLVQQIKT